MANETPTRREVRILFTGLFFFSFTDYFAEGHVGIFPTSIQHDLCLRLTENGIERDFKIYQNALDILPKQIIIEKISGAKSEQPDVTVPGGFTRPEVVPDVRPDGSRPFGLIVDFDALHPGEITIDTSKFLSVLRFKTGEFYTADLGEALSLKLPAETAKDLGKVASAIGIRVSLTDTQDLVFTDGGSLYWTLPRSITEVEFDDACPVETSGKTSSGGAAGGTSGQGIGRNDMQQYYPLLGVPEAKRGNFVVVNSILETEPFVCYTGGGSNPRSLVG